MESKVNYYLFIIVLRVKCGGGAMFWVCFSASGHERLPAVNLEFCVLQQHPEGECVVICSRPQGAGPALNKSLEWPGQSPDLNLIEMLGLNYNRSVKMRGPTFLLGVDQDYTFGLGGTGVRVRGPRDRSRAAS